MNGLLDFLVIGAQKAGTSWLHRNLCEHPGIFLPEAKDQGYFCWCQGPQAVSLDHYRRYFDPCLEGQIAGEATAAYFWTNSGSEWDVKPEGYCADVPKRVLDTLGRDTRLILSLRDPVERAVSAYLHHIAFGDLDPGISLLDAGDFIGLIDMGFYAAHLRNWLRYFPLQQFLVLGFEQDIGKQPRQTLRRVYSFLGVDTSWQASGPEQPVFKGRERIWLDDEVWVLAGDCPDIPAREQQQLDGRRYCLLIDRATIGKLREIYTQDQAELRELIF